MACTAIGTMQLADFEGTWRPLALGSGGVVAKRRHDEGVGDELVAGLGGLTLAPEPPDEQSRVESTRLERTSFLRP